MKPKIFCFVVSTVMGIGLVSQASPQCNFAGLQVVLRNGADSLHPRNPVTYIDFANNAQFAVALSKMEAVGVPAQRVERAWVYSIKNLCGDRADRLTLKDVGPSQRLSGLMGLLGLN
jgi:hypothetical protein